MDNYDLTHLSDLQLVTGLHTLVAADHRTAAALLAHLAEVDTRQLYAKEAFSSLFDYCTRKLHMCEGSAYKRIRAARATKRFPIILDMVASGELHTTGVSLLSPHLTAENHRELLGAAVHKSKREIEILVAQLAPKADVPSRVRKLPAPPSALLTNPTTPAPVSAPPTTPEKKSTVAPLAPERFKVQFTAGAGLVKKLEHAQALLRHRLPSGDLAEVCERALDALIDKLERERFAKTDEPRAGTQPTSRTRHIPNEVRRQVVERDGLQCTFIDAEGRRCAATGFLELHHAQAFALGGPHTADNIAVLCAGHNAELARRDFGVEKMRAFVSGDKAAAGSVGPGDQQQRDSCR